MRVLLIKLIIDADSSLIKSCFAINFKKSSSKKNFITNRKQWNVRSAGLFWTHTLARFRRFHSPCLGYFATREKNIN